MRSFNTSPCLSRGKVLPYALIILFISFLFSFTVHAQTALESTGPVQLISPEQDSLVIAKKPIIQVAFTEPFAPENILVLFDGSDITGILDITPEGFEYRPVQVLMSGMHTISITIMTEDGYEAVQEFAFSTRHYEMFEEAYVNNELTTIYEGVLIKPHDVESEPHSRVESNLNSELRLKQGAWEFTLGTNIRYFDQSLPVFKPEQKGIDLINYLLEGRYTGENFVILTEIGDVQVNESENTVQGLGRRGGKLSFQYNDININTFLVQSKQVFGCRNARDCIGIEGTSEDHIMGVSAETSIMDNRVSLKTVYVTGGEEGSSFGLYTEGGGSESDTLGFIIKTDFFDQKLTTEAELDFSEFDADTMDEFDADNDTAYKLKANGYAGRFSYGAVYEYMGPDYAVVGNQGLAKNREGFSLNGSTSYDVHSVNLLFSRYNDNVKNDDLYPKVYTYQGMMDYSFSKFQSLPMGLSYSRSILDSTREPELHDPIRMDTDMLSARINYMKNEWNFGLNASHSVQDDREAFGNDTTTSTYSLTSSYLLEHVSVSPGFSFNRTTYTDPGSRTDTYTLNLDIRGDALNNDLTYGAAGTYNRTVASDGFTETDSYNANLEIAYLLGRKLLEFLNPTVGLRGTYRFTDDSVNNNQNEDFIIILALTTSMPFSF